MVRKLVLSLVAVLGVFAFAMAQNKQVSGTVVGGDGMPIAGATIIVEGTMNGTTSGADGSFTISAPTNGSLLVSFIGYETSKVAIAGKNNFEIPLVEDSTDIEDVIVVAFGTAKKEAFTGSAAVIKADDIAKTQAGNAAQALAGKVAGVQMVNSSGQPGSAPTIHIRGLSSISAGKEPLYVVDGMPYEGDLSNINPSDIESMTVLKDAASNALYGARGANGVIMITTKKGKHGDAVVTVDAKIGVTSRAVQEYAFITNPEQYYETHYDALFNYARNTRSFGDAHEWANANLIDGSYGLGYNVYTVPDGQYMIGTDGKFNPNATKGRKLSYNGQDYWLQPDDWNDEAYRSAVRQEYNVSVAGATERANFYASAGYLNEEGIVAHSDMERLTARLRADFQAKEWLRVGGNMAYTHFIHNSLDDEGNSGSSGNLFTLTSRVAPIYPVFMRDGEGNVMYDENGYQMYDYGDGRNAGLQRPVMGDSNPMSSYMLDTNKAEGNAFNGNMFADFYLYDGLTFTVNASASLDETRYNSVTNPYYGQYADSKGIATVEHYRSYAYNLQQLLTYTKEFGKHSVDVLLGHEYYNAKGFDLYGYNTNMFSQHNNELAGAVTSGATSSSRSEYNTEGYFTRVQYDYDDRLYFSASYRRDASSKFHPDNRWGDFWSVGGAWIMNKESWFDVDWVNMLKLKASIGQQGNDGIGNYLYTDAYSIRSSAGNVSVLFSSKGNKNITWETNTNINVGLEFEVLKSRISGTIDYFNRKTTDMLFSRPVPLSSGYRSYMDNIGDMVNRGIEVDLHFTPIRKKDFTWNVNVNFTHMKNEVTKLPPEKQGGFENGNYWLEEGMPYYTFYIPQYAGVDKATGQSLWWKDIKKPVLDESGNQVLDQQGNPATKVIAREKTATYNEASYYRCGDADPELFGGFGTSLQWKGLDFAVHFTYQIGGQVYDSGYAALMGSPLSGDTGNNIHKDILNAWSPENPNSNIPRWQLGDQYSASQSDRFLTDASYLNIQNINIGYTLPKKWTKKFMVDKLRIYVACDNVWYWSKRQGLDPRQSFSGATSSELYAPVRTISGGINIQF